MFGSGGNTGTVQTAGRPVTSTGKGYSVLPPKSGRGAKLPVVPGTVPANTGSFGGLFGGLPFGAGGASNAPADTRSVMGNRPGTLGTWRGGPQSRSLDADYYMDGVGPAGTNRSQLDTVVEAGRGVRKLPAHPGSVNGLQMQRQTGMVGTGNFGPQQTAVTANNFRSQQATVTASNLQNGPRMSGTGVSRFGVAGTAVTAFTSMQQRMQQTVPNGSAVNVLHNPGDVQMGNSYGPRPGAMPVGVGGGNQIQAEVQVMSQPQQPPHPSVQFAQPEWT